MLDTSYYIERVFPMFRVRFISVSDHYDSDTLDGGTGGIDVSFKFLAHEQYSHDLSRKVKSAKHARAIRGEHIMKNCVFGYKKAGNRMEIDEPAAETVRLIFALALDGVSASKIAARLYDEKRPTPGEYKRLLRQNTGNPPRCIWERSAIQAILANEQYIGTYTAERTKRLEVGNKRSIRLDDSEWIRMPNHHPAIVSPDTFHIIKERRKEKAEPQRKRKTSTSERYGTISSPLKGKVFCGSCGHRMTLSATVNPAFQCTYTRAAPDAECHSHRFLARDLEEIVLNKIREKASGMLRLQLTDDHEADAENINGIVKKRPDHSNPTIDSLRVQYERLVLGEISAETYKEAREAYDAESTTKAANTDYPAIGSKVKNLWGMVSDGQTATELTRVTIDALIEKVIVFPNQEVEVRFLPASLRGERSV